MASVKQHCDTLVEQEEEKVKHEQVQMSSSTHTGVSVDLNAQKGATVNATVLSGNTISGPVTINYNTAGNDTQKISETEMAEKQDMILKRFLETHKCTMKSKAECIFEGQEENEADLKAVYMEIFITEGDMKDVNQEHEILNIAYAFNNKVPQDKPIKCNDIFTELRKKNQKKIVLTKGIAGIGKTISVHKFILDWAEGKANQDVDCVFLLLFREINLMMDKDVSLHELLLEFYPELKDMEKTKLYKECNLAFIFDGLDESRLALKFTGIPVRDPVERKSLDVLFMNLVEGNLLPSALVWVTSRPAAANQIPRQCVGLFTEVRGFTDQHKEEYFRKRITDETVASRIISHIKTSRSLYIMCHIPVFCWITATVLQDILIENSAENISTTLTEMYIHFMLIQMNIKNQKYEEQGEIECAKHLQSNREMILKLTKLAFEQLKKKSVMFLETDLKACGIDVSKDTEFTGMIAEILQKKNVIHYKKVFSFVHLSVQEFLAAVHVFICYLNKNMQELQYFFDEPEESITLQELLQKAIAKATLSEGGYLDLFLRFLMGITLESSQDLLEGLIKHTEDTTESIKKTTKYIKQVQDGYTISDEASVNLFYCLLELKDHSLYEEIQRYISSNEHQERKLSSSKCTVLIYILLMSEKVLDEFNPRRFTSSQENYKRFVPAVRCCTKALFDSCGLDKTCWETVSFALQSSNSHLTELDLSSNDLQDSGVKLLYDGLKSSHCRLNILRLCGCNLTVQSCESLSSALQSSNTVLRELDLNNNDLKDSGVKFLSNGLKSPVCKLEILRLSGCMVTKEGCGYLSSALSSNLSHLRKLDLSYNHPGDSGVKLLNHPNCTQDKNMDNGGESRITAGLKKYACFLTLDPNTANNYLIMSEENRKVTYMEEDQSYPDHPERFDVYQILCRESLTGRCYWEAEWSGAEAVISVTYKGIGRKGRRRDCMLGRNQISWSLLCTEAKFTMRHNYSSVDISVPSHSSNRVGVYVDVSAGILSFYSVSDTHTLTHLHTLNTTFKESLYAGFGVYDFNSVSLCDVSSLCKEPPVRH
ncbi:NACHT, LRR and PYD domains-containing protein 3-like isoform X2 [Carassius carassius]|uniref:NACHT, LRR and PYD domains-containing protein 3-like isoform X2 n=1 Tax=Carassius carassius TaxID=217509 RepID=UPI00286864BD|nr:NACHT, LRR and PYD domains-containing protein 3-like isoform X2 [Carassius carassius]